LLFTGEYEHTIDAKSRLAIPAEIRAGLEADQHGTAFYVAPGKSDTLWLWPERLFSQASRVEMDRSGRIRIPERLLTQACLGSSVMLLGVKDHLELRDPERWARQRDEKLAKQSEIMMRARRALQRARTSTVEDR
jgi:MraZ protein